MSSRLAYRIVSRGGIYLPLFMCFSLIFNPRRLN